MHLITPKGLHYPITVTNLRCKIDDKVIQHAPVFDYKYKSTVLEGSEDNKEGIPVERTFQSTFESYLDGTLSGWSLQVGTVLTRPGARVADILEVCSHAVQFGGLCAECGMDMTKLDYNTVEAATSRATVNTVHGHTTLLISEAEASKSDQEAKRRLISARKLSLVVDLDQTVIHAAVDTTIGEWQSDPDNPNYHALTDVKAFTLRGDIYTYFIKPRPGLSEFLQEMSKHYEMHVYTAATRDYAEEIAKIIDPTGEYFADRILSRDESGNKTYKSLKRLFPVDTNMVVIIDDRGDVWHWSRNLVRVKPFDFFVGVGDINSAFLPKQPTVDYPKFNAASAETPTVSSDDPSTVVEEAADSKAIIPTTEQPDPARIPARSKSPMGINDADDVDGDDADIDSSGIDRLIAEVERNDSATIEEQSQETDEKLAAQAAEKPMLQQQKMLDDADSEDADVAGAASVDTHEDSTRDPPVDDHLELHRTRSKNRHSLLHNDDDELIYLSQGLQKIHDTWYDRYDRSAANVRGSRVAELRPGVPEKPARDGLGHVPDVADVMRDIKEKVLKGLHIVHTGVVPVFGVRLQDSWIYRFAISYGATVTEEITSQTTHVIAHPQRKTMKVRKAARYRDRLKIVSLNWLEACANQLRRVSETPYLLHQDLAPSPPTPTRDSSSPPGSITNEVNGATNGSSAETGTLANGDETDDEDNLEAYMPTHSREETSPERETKEDWASIDDELNDFLGSDAESESEAESVTSRETNGGRTPLSERKRKLDELDSPTADGESDTDAAGASSKLQKRKRKALARVSSLGSNVTTPVDGDKRHALNTDRLEILAESNDADTTPQDYGSERGSDSIEDDLEAELEAEMLRQEDETADPVDATAASQ